MSRSNCCTTPISHKSSDAHTPTLPFVAVTQSGGKPGLGVPNGNVQVIPGERMEIDFAGDNLKWIDPNCDVQRARLFIAVLPYSNLTYAEAFPYEKQQSWISGIVHALEYFGGCRRSSSWTKQRHSSSTRAGTRAKCSRRCAPCATTMASSRGRVSPVVPSRKTESRPV